MLQRIFKRKLTLIFIVLSTSVLIFLNQNKVDQIRIGGYSWSKSNVNSDNRNVLLNVLKRFVTERYGISFEETGIWENITLVETLTKTGTFQSVTVSDELYTYTAYSDVDISSGQNCLHILALVKKKSNVLAGPVQCVAWYAGSVWEFEEIRSLPIEVFRDHHNQL